MRKEYTAIAKDNYGTGPHSWTKGLDYQLIVKRNRIILASDQGEIRHDIDEWHEIDSLFDITEGWNPSYKRSGLY